MTFRVLVVDDEPHVVESIIDLLSQTNEFDLDLYRAYSAPQALSILEAGRIDLVISDIEMPEISGLELIRRIHEKWPCCYVAFLTAYARFQYAYEAIALHSAGYILKTEDDETIVAKIMDILCEINRSRIMKVLPFSTQIDSDTSEQGQFLHEKDPVQLSQRLQAMQFPASHTAFCLIVCQSDQDLLPEQMTTIHRIIKHYLHDNVGHMAFEIIDKRYMVELLEIPSSHAPEYFSCMVDVLELAQATCYSVLNVHLSSIIHPFDLSTVLPFQALELTRKQIPRLQDALSPLFCDMAQQNTGLSENTDKNLQQVTVEWLQQYIRQNLSGDISMMKLSALTGYNAQYLSGIFHQHAHQTVTRFIAQERLMLVKKLLTLPNSSYLEVMKAAGFTSRSYFNRFIKRETDMTPQQLRSKLLTDIIHEPPSSDKSQ